MGVSESPKEGLEPDIVEELSADHAWFRHVLAELDETDDADRRARGVDEVARALAAHEAVEEQLVHPRVGRAGTAGDRARRLALTQERQAKWVVQTALRRSLIRPHSRGLSRSVHRLRVMVDRHARHEEEHVFPVLRRDHGDRELRTLGAAARDLRHLAPTRPHPGGPQSAVRLALAAPLVGPLDRARDLLRRAARRRVGRAQPGR